jgi:hypothetical protein
MSATGLQKVTPKKTAFLAAFTKVASISKAAKLAGVSRQAHYKWHGEDEVYRSAFAAAKSEALMVLEDEMMRRAIHGVERLKFDAKGRPIMDPRTGKPYVEHAYSDNLAMFLAKSLAPDKYREHSHVTLNGHTNVTLTARMNQLQKMINEIGDGDRTQTNELKRKVAERNCSVLLDGRQSGNR